MSVINWEVLGHIADILALVEGLVLLTRTLSLVWKKRKTIAAILHLFAQWVILIAIVAWPMIAFILLAMLLEPGRASLLAMLELLGDAGVLIIIPSAVSAATATSRSQAQDRALVVELIIGLPCSIVLVTQGMVPTASLFMRVMVGLTGVSGFLAMGYWEAELAWFTKQQLASRGWFSAGDAGQQE
jgi:hypothetical protein